MNVFVVPVNVFAERVHASRLRMNAILECPRTLARRSVARLGARQLQRVGGVSSEAAPARCRGRRRRRRSRNGGGELGGVGPGDAIELFGEEAADGGLVLFAAGVQPA